MPFALVAFGLLLTIAGARGTQGNLFALLKGDFTGDKSFLYWGGSIVGIGALGYIPTIRPLANVFLALILVVFILAQYKSGNNIFEAFIQQLKAGTSSSAAPAANDNPSGASNPLATGAAILRGSLGS